MPHSSQPAALRFCHADELHAETLHLLDALERADDPTRHRRAPGDPVVELARADHSTPRPRTPGFEKPSRLEAA